MRLLEFLSDVSIVTFSASSLFFFRFYKNTRDRFFLWFAAATLLLVAERLICLLMNDPLVPLSSAARESVSTAYLIRLMAFVMIAWAVAQKNRASR